MVNSLNNIKNLQKVKTVMYNVNNKLIMGLIQVDWKGYQKIDGRLYLITCTDTFSIPVSSKNVFSVFCEIII